MEGFTPSVLVMIILAVIVGFVAGYFLHEAKREDFGKQEETAYIRTGT